MANLAVLRQAVANAGAGPVGGRTYAYMPDQLAVGPEGALIVIIDPGDPVIERTFGKVITYRMKVRIVVGGASAEERQRVLDERISPTGLNSVWAALETTGIIPGIDYVVVERATNYTEYGDETVRYLAADLAVALVERDDV